MPYIDLDMASAGWQDFDRTTRAPSSPKYKELFAKFGIKAELLMPCGPGGGNDLVRLTADRATLERYLREDYLQKNVEFFEEMVEEYMMEVMDDGPVPSKPIN